MTTSLIAKRLWSKEALSRVGRVGAFVALPSALALASYAQYSIGRSLPGWMPSLSRINKELIRIYDNHPQSVLLSFGLFVGASLLFLVATRKVHGVDPPQRYLVINRGALYHGPWGKLSLLLFLAGAGLWGYVVAKLWSRSYAETYPLLFSLSLAGLAAPFVRWDLSAGLRLKFKVRWWEPLLVVALAGTFFILNVHDLDGWRYSWIGDDLSFFATADQIEQGMTKNLFSQAGAHGYHPLGSSAYQALVMKVFGADYFGWKMASLLAIVATIPAFYVLTRLTFGVAPAVYATVFLSASHYLFSYAHTGYNNILALLPVTVAFALFIAGWRYSSTFALFASGIASGLGFYTFFSARAAIVILALFVLTMGFRWWRPAFVGPLALGFVLAALPIFAVDRAEVVEAMIDQSATVSGDPVVRQFLENLPRSLFAFNFSPYQGHYMAGPLMDVASAVLAVLGLSYALSRIRSGPYRFLLIWYAVALTATGLFFRYDRVAFTRMHIVLPAMAAFAGIAVDRILAALQNFLPFERVKPALAVVSLAVLAPLLFALNIDRFWDESARLSGTEAPTVAVRAVLEGPCKGNAASNAIVSERASPILSDIFRIYGFTDDGPTLLAYEGTSSHRLASTPCVVMMDVEGTSARALLADLVRSQPDRPVKELTDLSGLHRVIIVGPAEDGY